MKSRGRPVRGLIGGLLLGIFLDFDLALAGTVKLDSVVLTILPPALLVVGLLLGIWAPLGRTPQAAGAPAAPLPPPVAWPESAPVEGSAAPAPEGQPPATSAPPPAEPGAPAPPDAADPPPGPSI